jgi:hypothetical protein
VALKTSTHDGPTSYHGKSQELMLELNPFDDFFPKAYKLSKQVLVVGRIDGHRW